MKGTSVLVSAACLLAFWSALPSFAFGATRCTGAQRSASVPANRHGAAGTWLASAPGPRSVRRAPAPQAAEGGGSRGAGCESCESWSTCLDGLGGLGASAQVVPLKNGVMYVYTADRPAGIRALQSLVAQHQERLRSLRANARLCPACRALRRASLRGRLSLEVLNIDGGCIVVTTSSDPAVVKRIYAEAGVSGTLRVKG